MAECLLGKNLVSALGPGDADGNGSKGRERVIYWEMRNAEKLRCPYLCPPQCIENAGN